MLKKRIGKAIQEKIDELAGNTKCNSQLLGILISKSAITQEERETLETLKSNKGDIAAAKELYKIVVKNEISERILLHALEETQQSGAFVIIKSFNSNVCFDVQNPTSSFVGRKEELFELENAVYSSNSEKGSSTVITQPITGIGGIGKTELCRQFLSNIQNRQINKIWLNADNEGTITASFKRLAVLLKIPVFTHDGQERDMGTIIKQIFQDLDGSESIVVYDNCDEPALLRDTPYLPTSFAYLECRPKILLTSRNIFWPGYKQIVVDRMKLEDAVKLVEKTLKKKMDRNDCKKLVEILECFPLAIRQATAYINQQNSVERPEWAYSIQDYIQDFETTKEILESTLFQGIDSTYSKTTYTTWKVTIDTLIGSNQLDQDSLQIIHVIGYLDPESINKSIFQNIFGQKKTEGILGKTLNYLVEYSILYYDEKQDVISIHRLLQHVIRLELNVAGKEKDIVCKSLQLLERNGKGISTIHATSVWRHASKHREILDKFYDKLLYSEKELSPLHLLAQDGNIKGINSIAEWISSTSEKDKLKDKRINRTDGYNRTALFIASSLGHAEIVEKLLSLDADPKTRTTLCYSSFDELKINLFDSTEWTALHVAAYYDRRSVIQILVKVNPSLVNDFDGRMQTPPLIAILLGNIGSVKIMKKNNKLFKACALISYVVKGFGTLSELDKYLGKIKKKEKILNENLVEDKGYWAGLSFTPVRVAAHVKAPPQIFDLLQKHGAKLFRYPGDYRELLHFCGRADNGILAEYIFQNVRNPNLEIVDGPWTILHCAGQNGGTTLIKQIIERFYVNFNAKDRHGDTPLYQAAYNGHLKTAKYLIKNGADVNAMNKLGCTPVIAAAISYKLDMVEYLISLDECKIFPWETAEEKNTLLGGLGITVLHVLVAYDELATLLGVLNIRNIRDEVLRQKYSVEDLNSPKLTLLHSAALFNSINCRKYLNENTDSTMRSAKLNVLQICLQFYKAAEKGCFELPHKSLFDRLIKLIEWAPNNRLYNLIKWVPNSIFTLNSDQISSVLEMDINHQMNRPNGQQQANIVLRFVAQYLLQAKDRIQLVREYLNVQKNPELQAGKELTKLVKMFRRQN